LIGVLLGNGDGTFQNAATYPSGAYDATAVLVTDTNKDGLPDLIVANGFLVDDYPWCCIGGVAILLGNGDGTFQSASSYPTSQPDGGYPDSLSLVDVHGDGTLSVVVANSNRNNGPGKVTVGLDLHGGGALYGSYGSGGWVATAVAVADVNGDGRGDILVANACATLPACSNSVVGVRLRQPATTKTAVSSSSNPSLINQPVTFTATVTSALTIPNGQLVTFYDGNTAVGTGTTTGGKAMFTTSSLSAKSHVVKAIYPGNFDLSGSSGTVKQVVNP
jgi:hypothetical protein